MKKLFNTAILYLCLSYSAQAFAPAVANSDNKPVYEDQYSEIIAADQAIQKQNFKKGIDLYQQYLDKNPNDKVVLITLFRLQLMQGNYRAAKKLLSLYLSRFGKDDAYLTEKARYFVLVNQSEEAFQTLIAHKKYTLETILTGAETALRNKEYKKAITLYQQYLQERPNDKSVIIALIRVQSMYGSLDTAEDLLDEYFNKFGKDNAYITEKARYFVFSQEPEEALDILGPMLRKDPSNKVLLSIEQLALNVQARQNQLLILTQAQKAINNKDYQRAIRFYQQYLNKNPNSKAVILDLARLQLTHGSSEIAMKLLASYSSQFGEDEGYLTEKARYFALADQYDEALAIINPLLKKNPSNQSLLNIKQYALANKTRQNRAMLDLMLTAAQKAIQNEDYEKGLAFYQEYLSKNPSDKGILLVVIQLQLKLANAQAVNQLLSDYLDRFGKDDDYLASQAKYLVMTNKLEEALAIINSLIEKDPTNKDLSDVRQVALRLKAERDKIRFQKMLAKAKQAIVNKDYQQGIALYQEYLSSNPNNKTVTMTLIQLQIDQKNSKAGNMLLAAYQHRFGQDDAFRAQQARLLILSNKPEQALALLDSLLKKNSKDEYLLDIKQYALNEKAKHDKIISDALLAEAQRAVQNQDYKQGIALYQNYLSSNPENKIVLLTLIQLQLKQADVEAAGKQLLLYLNRFGEDDPYLRLKAHYLALTTKPEEALAILTPLLEKDPKNKSLLAVKEYAFKVKEQQEKTQQAAILLAAKQAFDHKDYKKSIALYMEYLSKNPNDKEVTLTLIQLQMQTSPETAKELLAGYLKKFGSDDAYIAEKARYFVVTNNLHEAFALLEPRLKKNPSNLALLTVKQFALDVQLNQDKVKLETMVADAKEAIKNKNYIKGIALYQEYLEKNPDDKAIMLTLIDLKLQIANYLDADKLLVAYVKRFGQDDGYLAQQARYLVLTNKLEQALAVLEPLLKKDPSNKVLLAVKQYALNVKAYQEKVASELLLTEAKQAINKKDYRKGIALYKEYLEKNPNDKTVILALINIKLEQGKQVEADKLLAAYLKKFGEDAGYLAEKARYLVLRNQLEEALALLDTLLKKDPTNKILLDTKQYALSLKAYQFKLNLETMLVTAKDAVKNKDYKKGIAVYREYLEKNPEDKAVTLALIQVLLQSNPEGARVQLAAYLKKFGEDDAYLAEKARYFVLTNNLDDAIALLEPALEKNPSNKNLLEIKQYAVNAKAHQDQVKLANMLASANQAIADKNFKRGAALYQQYLDKNPDDKSITLALIQVQMQINVESAKALLETYLKKFGEDDGYLAEKARYLVLTNKLEEALAVLGPLLKKDPSNKMYLDINQYALSIKARQDKIKLETMLANANQAIQDKDYKKGIALYEEYLNKNPSDKKVTLTLIQLQMKENIKSVNALLTNYLTRFGEDEDYLTEKARYLVLTNKLEEALALLGSLLKQDPSNKVIADVNQYALKVKAEQEKMKLEKMLADAKQAVQIKDYSKGIALYEEYLKKSPGDKAVLLALIELKLQLANAADAEKLLAIYLKQFGKDDGYQIQQAHFLVLSNKSDEALAIIDPLLEKDPANKNLLDSKKLALANKERQEKIIRDFKLVTANDAVKKKEIKQAIALYEQYLSSNPNDKVVMMTIIQLQMQQANYPAVHELLAEYSTKFGQDEAYFAQEAQYFDSQSKQAAAVLAASQIQDPAPRRAAKIKIPRATANASRLASEEIAAKEELLDTTTKVVQAQAVESSNVSKHAVQVAHAKTAQSSSVSVLHRDNSLKKESDQTAPITLAKAENPSTSNILHKDESLKRESEHPIQVAQKKTDISSVSNPSYKDSLKKESAPSIQVAQSKTEKPASSAVVHKEDSVKKDSQHSIQVAQTNAEKVSSSITSHKDNKLKKESKSTVQVAEVKAEEASSSITPHKDNVLKKESQRNIQVAQAKPKQPSTSSAVQKNDTLKKESQRNIQVAQAKAKQLSTRKESIKTTTSPQHTSRVARIEESKTPILIASHKIHHANKASSSLSKVAEVKKKDHAIVRESKKLQAKKVTRNEAKVAKIEKNKTPIIIASRKVHHVNKVSRPLPKVAQVQEQSHAIKHEPKRVQDKRVTRSEPKVAKIEKNKTPIVIASRKVHQVNKVSRSAPKVARVQEKSHVMARESKRLQVKRATRSETKVAKMQKNKTPILIASRKIHHKNKVSQPVVKMTQAVVKKTLAVKHRPHKVSQLKLRVAKAQEKKSTSTSVSHKYYAYHHQKRLHVSRQQPHRARPVHPIVQAKNDNKYQKLQSRKHYHRPLHHRRNSMHRMRYRNRHYHWPMYHRRHLYIRNHRRFYILHPFGRRQYYHRSMHHRHHHHGRHFRYNRNHRRFYELHRYGRRHYHPPMYHRRYYPYKCNNGFDRT